MIDHLQQAANEQAQREYGERLRELQRERDFTRLTLRAWQGGFVLLAVLTLCAALLDRQPVMTWRDADAYSHAVDDLHRQLDDARAALDRCVTDLIEQPTPSGSVWLSGTVTTTLDPAR